jgi:hypothetical protein
VNRTSAFLLRRVFLGVLVGVTLLALGFFGWVQFRTSQYHQREAHLLSRYRSGYATCLRQQVTPAACALEVRDLCTHDQFWQREQPPFVIDLAPQLNVPELRCKETVPG